MSKRKKVIILSCLIALLVTTAVLNFTLSSAVISSEEATQAASYFTEVRTTRNSSRNQQLAQINEIISSSADGSEAKNEAIAIPIYINNFEILTFRVT